MSSTKEYTIGECYEGLGKYLGIITVYPHGVDYVERHHKFVTDVPDVPRSCAKVNWLLIKKISR